MCKGEEPDYCRCDIIGDMDLKGAVGGVGGISSQRKVNCQSCRTTPERWKPLLLIIPLRLGLTDINAVYVESLKVCESKYFLGEDLYSFNWCPIHLLLMCINKMIYINQKKLHSRY